MCCVLQANRRAVGDTAPTEAVSMSSRPQADRLRALLLPPLGERQKQPQHLPAPTDYLRGLKPAHKRRSCLLDKYHQSRRVCARAQVNALSEMLCTAMCDLQRALCAVHCDVRCPIKHAIKCSGTCEGGNPTVEGVACRVGRLRGSCQPGRRCCRNVRLGFCAGIAHRHVARQIAGCRAA